MYILRVIFNDFIDFNKLFWGLLFFCGVIGSNVSSVLLCVYVGNY